MEKKRKQAFWILISTFVLILFISYGTFKFYKISLDETKRYYQFQQKEIANAASLGITSFLNHLEDEVKFLASLPGLQYFKDEPLISNVNYFFRHVENPAVKAIFVADINSHIFYSTQDTLPSWINKLVIRRQQSLGRENSWYSPVRYYDDQNQFGERCMVFLLPLIQYYQDTIHPYPSDKQVGFIGCVVNFDWLMQRYVVPLKPGFSGNAWVVDGYGRLLFHPSHSEMVFRTITENVPAKCQTCHFSFEAQRKILLAEEGTEEYTVYPEPTKLMAYLPMKLHNEKLILVISTHLAEVTAIMRDKFKIIFIGLVVIILIIIATAYSFQRINTKRILAEEEQRHFQQRELLQRQIDHSAKLASIGELVDTVAHEINTPSSIISIQSDALRLEMKKNKKHLNRLKIIKKQTHRINSYARRLLDFSQRIPFQPEKAHLDKIADDCIYLLNYRLKNHNISLKKKYPKNMPLINIDREQIEQLFFNLLNNSIDSIENRGEIKIKISPIQENSEDGIQITISDNGKGISKENMPHIFEPFFTTKQNSHGTGLGLYITKSIIQRHKGNIHVNSELGKGTTFQIYLPFINSKRNPL